MNAELHYVSVHWRNFALALGLLIYGLVLFLRPKAAGRERLKRFRNPVMEIALIVCGSSLLVLLIHGFLYPKLNQDTLLTSSLVSIAVVGLRLFD
jgi:hypothetical protein